MSSESKIDDTKVVLALIAAVVVILLAIILAFYLDELNDHDTEKACVQNTSDSSRSCDV